MSGSDRGSKLAIGDVGGLLAALVLCCLVVGIVEYSSGRQDEQQHQQAIAAYKSGGHHQQRPQQADTDHAGVPAFAERAISNPEPTGGTERENRDLAAQENTAAWAFWMVLLTAAQFILSGFGLVALLVTIRQGREANAISNRVGEAQVRAYLSVTMLGITLTQKGFEVSYTCRNSGQSPARAVHIFHDLYPASYPTPTHQAASPLGDLAAQTETEKRTVQLDLPHGYIPLVIGPSMLNYVVRMTYFDVFDREQHDSTNFTIYFNARNRTVNIAAAFVPVDWG